MTIPADANESAKLAKHYGSASLGEISVGGSGSATVFDFGEWKSEVGSRKNPDGTISFNHYRTRSDGTRVRGGLGR